MIPQAFPSQPTATWSSTSERQFAEASQQDFLLALKAEMAESGISRLVGNAAKANNGRWFSKVLMQNQERSCSLLVIKAGATIPLHDHPGASGTHLVLNGSTQHYQFNVTGKHNGAWTLVGVPKARKLLKPSDMVSFHSDHGNAHSFIAGAEDCILIHITQRSNQPSYWYIPTQAITAPTVSALRKKRTY